MKKHTVSTPFALPMTMALLVFVSWETIVRRSFLMAQGDLLVGRISTHGARKGGRNAILGDDHHQRW